MTAPLRFGQIGTRHGHAAGKWLALSTNPRVEPVGIYEPDSARRGDVRFGGARWFDSAAELLGSCEAVAVEGRNVQSLDMAHAAIAAGQQLWFDKPAGDDLQSFETLLETSKAKQLYVQMGYMFRYSPAFQRIAALARGGALGKVFAVRAHMSTNVDLKERTEQSRHQGGILYDLGGHMLDQIVWLLGRPIRTSAVLRNDGTPELPGYVDNAVAVLEFDAGQAIVDIAAMEPAPTARRFEVYGTAGSVILDGFDPPRTLRSVLNGACTIEQLPEITRQSLYDAELAAFVEVVRDGRAPDRTSEHEHLVQQTLLRLTRGLG